MNHKINFDEATTKVLSGETKLESGKLLNQIVAFLKDRDDAELTRALGLLEREFRNSVAADRKPSTLKSKIQMITRTMKPSAIKSHVIEAKMAADARTEARFPNVARIKVI